MQRSYFICANMTCANMRFFFIFGLFSGLLYVFLGESIKYFKELEITFILFIEWSIIGFSGKSTKYFKELEIICVLFIDWSIIGF